MQNQKQQLRAKKSKSKEWNAAVKQAALELLNQMNNEGANCWSIYLTDFDNEHRRGDNLKEEEEQKY